MPVDGPDSQDVTLVDNVETFTSQTINLEQSEKTTGNKRRLEGGCNPTPSRAVCAGRVAGIHTRTAPRKALLE